MTNLETRLAKLERENRWIKRVGMVVILVVGMATVIGVAGQDNVTLPDEIKVKRLTVGNDRGETSRIHLKAPGFPKASDVFWAHCHSKDNDPQMVYSGMTLFTENGDGRHVAAERQISSLMRRTENDKFESMMWLSDDSGKKRILLSVGEDGVPSIRIMDSSGKKVIWQAPPQKDK